IVITKWIGLEGTSIIAKDHEEELLTRLPQGLIDTAKRSRFSCGWQPNWLPVIWLRRFLTVFR
ncbi:MAG: hypothetical protein II704_06215, partial [Erysipelotrichaceae bacterium]|nr:hypothetical protein [Erysipelotrichaceae bacterium]